MYGFLISIALCMPFGESKLHQPAPDPDPIHWPVTPVPPPPPPPAPTDVLSMTADQLFVIGIDSDAVVIASPPNLVSVSSDTGPIKIRGNFVGGNGIETRTFTNKQVVVIGPLATGRVEIIVVWGSLGSAGKVERRFIDVSGSGPVPPSPPSPSDPFAQAVLAAYASEVDTAKSSEVAKLAAIYRLSSSQVAGDQTLATTVDLWNRMHTARQVVMPDSALIKVRSVIATELNKTLSNPITFDTQSRATVAALLAKVATILESIK